MSATRLNDAVLSLLSAYAASPGLSGVPVYDGVVAMTGSDPDCIIVGHTGALAADGTLAPVASAGGFQQGNLVMPGVREETGWVGCVIVSQVGDVADVPGRRQRATNLLAAAEDAAAANGGYPQDDRGAGLMFDGTASGQIVNRLSQGGVAVILAYRVSYASGY
jgi:hypothetical protein